jgi:cytochrome b561
MIPYPRTMLAIHWLTAAAVAIAYLSSDDPTHGTTAVDVWMGSMHVAAGLWVLGLVLVRLPVRLLSASQRPVSTPMVGAWRRLQRLPGYAHAALYVLMLVTPALGWIALSTMTPDFAMFGSNWSLPLLNQTISVWLDSLGDIGEIHAWVGNLFIALIGIHAEAALLHNLVIKDNTLRTMLPKRFQTIGPKAVR